MFERARRLRSAANMRLNRCVPQSLVPMVHGINAGRGVWALAAGRIHDRGGHIDRVTMATSPKKTNLTCAVCNESFPRRELRPWISVRPSISVLIAGDAQDWGDGCFICLDDLARYRRLYVERLLEEERGEIGALEREVISSLETGQPISEAPDDLLKEHLTFGDRMADRVAVFGGSWTFILSFCAVLVIWMILNTTAWLFDIFDPFPFILLNLVLSCIAALQAPIIMMSQRRQ